MGRRFITCPVSAHLAVIDLSCDLHGRIVRVDSCSEAQRNGRCSVECARRLNTRAGQRPIELTPAIRLVAGRP